MNFMFDADRFRLYGDELAREYENFAGSFLSEETSVRLISLEKLSDG